MTSYPFPGCLTGRRSDAMEHDEKGPEGLGLNGAEHLTPPPLLTDHYITATTIVVFPPQRTGQKARGRGFKVRLRVCDTMEELKKS